MIEFKGVTKAFKDRVVLSELSFHIPRGQIVFILGMSGTGKSVLLKNIVGLLRPDKVNPGSLILSGQMMLDFMGWKEAAALIEQGLQKSILAKRVTYDFHRAMEGATLLKTSEFGQEIISHMN